MFVVFLIIGGVHEDAPAVEFNKTQQAAIEHGLLNSIVLHPKVEFRVGASDVKVEIFFALHFHILRHWLLGDDLQLCRALLRTRHAETSGGKSGSDFYLSLDGRFMVKKINSREFAGFQKSGTAFFHYYHCRLAIHKHTHKTSKMTKTRNQTIFIILIFKF